MRTSASLVCSPEGEFVTEAGSSKGLGGDADLAWLRALRSQCQVVLTSGLTFRVEKYRMPKTADLAVLTRQALDTSNLAPTAKQLHVITSVDSYSDSIRWLQEMGYVRIHVEFGPTGIRALLESKIPLQLWISSPSSAGLLNGASSLGCGVSKVAEVDGLHIGIAR